MVNKCFTPLLGKRIRVTALDSCGVVPAVAAVDSYIATDGFISVSLSSEVEEGAEIILKKADGSLCVNEKKSPSFKRFTLELTFCGVNPSLLAFVSNAEPYEGPVAGEVIGFTVPEGEMKKRFALELWTGMAGAACSAGGGEASGYLLLPHIQSGTLGNVEVTSDSAVTFSLTGAYTIGSNTWGKGPYKVINKLAVASNLPTALDPMDHLLLVDVDVAPPASACDPQPMPAAI